MEDEEILNEEKDTQFLDNLDSISEGEKDEPPGIRAMPQAHN